MHSISRQVKYRMFNVFTILLIYFNCLQIEDLYQVNSRNNMNETLYKCITDAIVRSECVSPYRIIVESSTLITVLHTNVGSEIGN